MNINELIDFYKWKYEQAEDFTDPHWEANEKREHREYIERLKATIEMLEELQWYHSQDLVDRDGAIDAIKTTLCYAHIQGFRDTDCEQATFKDCELCNLKHLPKAEPPKERNGDCETCKHYDEPKYCNNCYIRDDEMPNAYEPYIPKKRTKQLKT